MKENMRKLVEEGYNKGDYGGTYRKKAVIRGFEKKFIGELTKRLPKDANILDFGSGLGIPYDRYFVSKGFEVVGIDISSKHIGLAKKNVPEATFIKGDFSKLKLNGKFDAIVSFYAIFHIPRDEHKKLFQKMHKLLKNRSFILVTLGASGDKYSEEKNWTGAPMAWSQYDSETYEKILKEVGFKIVKSEFEGKPGDAEYHFWVLANKK